VALNRTPSLMMEDVPLKLTAKRRKPPKKR
jgi:hypothetical protein